VATRVTEWLKPLDGERDLAEWCPRLVERLTEVYAHCEFDPMRPDERASVQCFRFLQTTLEAFQAIPRPLMPRLSAAEAIGWLVAAAARETSAAPAEPAIELLGWLELPLDDAPALIVTSLNEGFVPQSVNTDLFLPNALRAELGLLDNQRRLARDAYALRVLLHSRQELRLIVGRRTREGDPLAPSRLLFATDGETAARRAHRFFAEPEVPRFLFPAEPPSALRLEVPHPQPLPEPILRFSVTCFRDFLPAPRAATGDGR
jgi:hypothetical protein